MSYSALETHHLPGHQAPALDVHTPPPPPPLAPVPVPLPVLEAPCLQMARAAVNWTAANNKSSSKMEVVAAIAVGGPQHEQRLCVTPLDAPGLADWQQWYEHE